MLRASPDSFFLFPDFPFDPEEGGNMFPDVTA
jgi:hypothetical protein